MKQEIREDYGDRLTDEQEAALEEMRREDKRNFPFWLREESE